MRIDPLTGLEVEDLPPYKPEYWVCVREEYLPEGNRALGIDQAIAFFDTKVKALEYQINTGVGGLTYIREV